MDQILGHIENIVYIASESGFTVARIKERNKNKLTTIVGYMPNIRPGESLQCEGEWKFHSKHGKQFDVQTYAIRYPSDILGIQKYLSSGLVKGIGPIYAKKIVEKFGIDTLLIIDKTPNRLKEVPGVGKKRIDQIISCWSEQKIVRDVMVFLQGFEVSPAYAQKIFKRYGKDSITVVKDNPYQLARDIFGIGFKIADNIARKMGFEKNSPKRIEAGIAYVLENLALEGHTCYPEKEFFPIAENILEVESTLIKEVLEKAISNKLIIRTSLPRTDPEDMIPHLWIKSLFLLELGISKDLLRISKSPSALRSVKTKKAVEWVQEKLFIKLAQEQSLAVEKAISEKLHIITGGPGTGKSTIINAVLGITEKITNKIILAAPTGRAAKRMTQITRKKAHTIHALLEYDFSNNGFKKNQDNLLKCHLLIIDEASMIDTYLMYHLLKAIPDNARVLFVGDIDQLPSVGPGYVLKNMIASNEIGVTKLKKIFRQAAGSKIIYNAHRINQGLFPHITTEEKSDFYFIEKENPDELLEKIIDLNVKTIPQRKKFHPMDEIQVLSPMKKGKIGTENLNLLLQNALNPSTKPLFQSGNRFHIGDKVMQTRNNYNKHIYNGDIGKIHRIDLAEQIVEINFDGRLLQYEFSELDEVILAYAVSIHKYQGSECSCIIIPIHTSHFKLLFRNLLYTGVTRGKKLVVLLGTKQAVAMAIKNNEVLRRHTGLEYFISQQKLKKNQYQEILLPGFSS